MEKYNYISALIEEGFMTAEQVADEFSAKNTVSGTEVNTIVSQLYIAGVIDTTDTTIVDLTTKYTIAAANNSPIADIILADIKQAIKEALMKVW